MITKTKVVDKNGNKPTIGRLILRTLIRLIPIDLFTFLLGNLGLHDLISKTTVIKVQKPN